MKFSDGKWECLIVWATTSAIDEPTRKIERGVAR
jgi:hypothetical protein